MKLSRKSMLSIGEIRSQLSGALEESSEKVPLVYCREVGNYVQADLLLFKNVREYYPCSHLGRMAGNLGEQLNYYASAQMIILVDLHVPGNEPEAGIVWTTDERTKGALMGAMSQLVVLLRDHDLKKILFEQPARLAIATIAEGKVTIHSGEGERMVRFLQSKMAEAS